MTTFSALLRWPTRPPFGLTAEALLYPTSSTPDVEVASRKVSGCEVAVALRPERKADRAEHAIFVSPDQHWLAVGDVRLFEAPEAGGVGARSDLERAVRIFSEQGGRGVSRIHGEFSFVILDWHAGTAQAFRDQLGARPLYFRVLAQGIAFASDLRQLLAFRSPADEPLDARMVADYLRDDFSSRSRTFFASIRQLVAGHRLEAVEGRVEQSRYWFPETAALSRLTYSEMVEEWRRLFKRAVTLRLDSDHPMASYLSGGMDSGSIVGVAHEDYVRRPDHRPPFWTLSALFPGTPYDETELIADACRVAPLFRSLTWDGTSPDSQDIESPLLAMPGLREGLARGPQTDLELVRTHGIRTVFSGFAGDEMGWARGYFRDLLVRGHLGKIAVEIGQFPSWRAGVRRLRADLKGLWTPRAGLPRIPTWAGDGMRRALPETMELERSRPTLPSLSQAAKWSLVNLPRLSYAVELTHTMLADVGARLVLPYRDLALTEFVLRIPWRLNAPGGDVRRVQRDAVAPYLSPEVRRNRRKTLFGVALQRQIRANEDRIRACLEAGEWSSQDFVIQRAAKAAFESLRRADPSKARIRDWLPFWRIAVFETWHRGILHYHGPRRMMMRDVTRSGSVDGPGVDSDADRPPYESPKIVSAGNVRDLLAQVEGPSFDAAPGADGQSP